MRKFNVLLLIISFSQLMACKFNSTNGNEIKNTLTYFSKICLPILEKRTLSGEYDELKLDNFLSESSLVSYNLSNHDMYNQTSFPLKYGVGLYGASFLNTNKPSYLHVSAGGVSDFTSDNNLNEPYYSPIGSQYCDIVGEFEDIETVKEFQRAIINIDMDLSLLERRNWNLLVGQNYKIKQSYERKIVRETRLCARNTIGKEFIIRFAHYPISNEERIHKFRLGLIEQSCNDPVQEFG